LPILFLSLFHSRTMHLFRSLHLRGRSLSMPTTITPSAMNISANWITMRRLRANYWLVIFRNRRSSRLNAVEAPGIEQEGRLPNSSERRAHPIAGDDPAAKQVIADLLNQFGFDFVDAGPLAEGRCFQKGTPAYCVPFNAKDLRLALARAVETMART
jgi:hypothetical protein